MQLQDYIGSRCVLIALLSIAVTATASERATQLNNVALQRAQAQVTYDGQYVNIPYPNGDVPANIGVCTDVVIRAYRAQGIDLQQRVHEDMKRHFSAYPSKRLWGMKGTDTNIDYRRVSNLRAFFKRHGETLAITQKGSDYHTGDLVTYQLPGNLPHIAIMTGEQGASGNPQIVHNIGLGPKLDDSLFDYPITGHYRYLPAE